MEKSKRGEGAPAEELMATIENARTANAYATVGPVGQQIFLEKLSHADSSEEQQRLTEELTK